MTQVNLKTDWQRFINNQNGNLLSYFLECICTTKTINVRWNKMQNLSQPTEDSASNTKSGFNQKKILCKSQKSII